MSWLPEHQQHVLYSLAHADDLIARTGTILYALTKEGVLDLKDEAIGDTVRLTVVAVHPIPQAVPGLPLTR